MAAMLLDIAHAGQRRNASMVDPIAPNFSALRRVSSKADLA